MSSQTPSTTYDDLPRVYLPSGNPYHTPFDDRLCAADVVYTMSRHFQCRTRPAYFEEGHRWCGRHAPSRVAKRNERSALARTLEVRPIENHDTQKRSQDNVRQRLMTVALKLMREQYSISAPGYTLPITLTRLIGEAVAIHQDGMLCGMDYEFDTLLGITSQRTDG